MNFRLYHHHRPGGFLFPEELEFPQDYIAVADIEADDYVAVFYLTQNMIDPWVLNPCVLRVHVPPSTVRSTSVGDVVIDEEGNLFRCMPLGWRQLTGQLPWCSDPSKIASERAIGRQEALDDLRELGLIW